MSQVMSLSYNLSGPFGDFGKNFQYDFNIVYMVENILEVGLNNTNVVVIPGDLTEDSKSKLEKYHIDIRKWKDDMIKYLNQPHNYKKIIHTFFENLPQDIQVKYTYKYHDIEAQISKMKQIL